MSSLKCAQCQNQSEMRCSRCRSANYCSRECQGLDWKTHKAVCFPRRITGVVIFGEEDSRNFGMFGTVDIGPNHEIHRFGDPCPVSELVGLPLVIYRHLKETPPIFPRTTALDNQIATYLMIDPKSGFAPPHWQQGVGTVTIMRKDGKPLTEAAAEMIWMYHDNILDRFGDDPASAHRIMNQDGFQRFYESYREQTILLRPEFSDLKLPL